MASAPNLRLRLVPVESMNIQVSLAPLRRPSSTPLFSSCHNSFIPSVVAQQIAEMQMVREKVYQMEQTHLALKAK